MTKTIPPFNPDDILRALMEQAVSGRGGLGAYPIHWGDEKPTLTGDRIRLRKDDAQPLVDAGLLAYQDNGTLHWYLTPRGLQEGAKLVPVPPYDLKALLTALFDLRYFEAPDPAIPYLWEQGDPASKLVLVLGENAGGKSFFRRIIRAMTASERKDDTGRVRPAGPFPVQEVVHLSMEGRGGYMGSFVYGDESYLSTGANSGNTITTGIKTVTGRTHTVIGYWDEPDIGMSNGTAAGAGVVLREFVEGQHPLMRAVFITTHSVPLVRQLTTGLAVKPHYIYLGDATGPATLADWFVYQQNPPPVTLDELAEVGHRRFKRIQAILNDKG